MTVNVLSNLHVFGLLKETGVPGGSPGTQKKVIQTLHRKARGGREVRACNLLAVTQQC